jgi:small-conductance mechanosensitive channel
VAGALSVGIGLGLQNIVNNFVSGLVLLIERPVKVGDWVGVGDKQGLVRRINVRSTELSTFERSTVILPNSQLLSSAVVNWTHRDKVGRIDIRVVVAFGADTEKVRATLLACAAAHPEILPRPEPFVLFLEFGDAALIFELRAFLRDVEKRARVGSDLRFSIEKAFRDAQIELPYAPGRTGKSLIQSPPIEKAPKVEIARGSGGGVR